MESSLKISVLFSFFSFFSNLNQTMKYFRILAFYHPTAKNISSPKKYIYIYKNMRVDSTRLKKKKILRRKRINCFIRITALKSNFSSWPNCKKQHKQITFKYNFSKRLENLSKRLINGHLLLLKTVLLSRSPYLILKIFCLKIIQLSWKPSSSSLSLSNRPDKPRLDWRWRRLSSKRVNPILRWSKNFWNEIEASGSCATSLQDGIGREGGAELYIR